MVTANTVKLVTTELKGLFDEWCPQIEKEMLDFIKEKGTIEIDGLAEKFSLSEGNIKYLLSRLAVKNLIDCKA
jgi:predicted transcriptional regulator